MHVHPQARIVTALDWGRGVWEGGRRPHMPKSNMNREDQPHLIPSLLRSRWSVQAKRKKTSKKCIHFWLKWDRKGGELAQRVGSQLNRQEYCSVLLWLTRKAFWSASMYSVRWSGWSRLARHVSTCLLRHQPCILRGYVLTWYSQMCSCVHKFMRIDLSVQVWTTSTYEKTESLFKILKKFQKNMIIWWKCFYSVIT